MDDLQLESLENGVILHVRAQPGARKNSVLGVRQGALRVAVTQAPEKGKANSAIIDVLSKTLGLRKSQCELISGSTSPQKKFLISEISAQEILDRLETQT
ncbi:MAG: DUF167 domain-containing protein [Planctomycetales bacterium]|nr:DUF167 domain-containing protein [Planctomycetales bacterium]